MHHLTARGARAALFLSTALLPFSAQAAEISPFLYSDQDGDAVYILHDRNGDGDVDDGREASIFFDGNNASGLSGATDNVYTFDQGADGSVFIGNGTTDTIYRLYDQNMDGDAQDAGEAAVWFSAANASGVTLHTPNGVGVGGDGAVFVVEADTRGNPDGDFVYRTRDLNGDGDAEDAGEAEVWLDLKALNGNASAFEIRFDGDVAYIADTRGFDADVVYRAEDRDGNGRIEGAEISELIDSDNPFGVDVSFAMDVQDGDVYLWEFLDFSGPSSLFKVTDLDGSGQIDALAEVMEVWDSSLLDPAYQAFVGFGAAVSDDGDVVIMSNGGSANQDWLTYLTDLNGDGDFRDLGETLTLLARSDNGHLPQRARNAQFYSGAVPVPLPAGAPLLIGGLMALRLRKG